MSDTEEFIESVLSHYSSPWYDPAKAHEYYMRTRELKGPSSSDLKGKNKKEAFTVAKSNIDTARRTETKTVQATQKAELAKVHQGIKARQAELHNSVKQILLGIAQNKVANVNAITGDANNKLKQLASERDVKLQKINADAQARLDALPPLPKGVSKDVKFMRSQEIAQIKGELKSKSGKVLAESKLQETQIRNGASSNKSSVSSQASSASKAQQEALKVQSQKVGSELKATITNAQKKYKGLREQTLAKYKAILQSEHDAIKQNS